MLVEKLFEKGHIHSLHPDNVVELRPGVVSPFSDYYGTLLDIEVLVRDNVQLHEEQQRELNAVLADNLFVPNYKTPRGRLNDRIRKLAGDSGALGAKSLASLVNGVAYEKERTEKGHKFGLSSQDIEQNAERYASLVTQVRTYGDLLQTVMFLLQPTKEPRSAHILSTVSLLGKSIQEGDIERYVDFRDQTMKWCIQREAGTPIQEKSFFYRGGEHKSTKGFVREWNRVIKEKERLDAIVSGKKIRKSRNTSVGRREVLGGLITIGTGVGVLYALPSLRKTLHMGVSDVENVELLIDQGRYETAVSVAIDLPENSLYWRKKAEILQVIQNMNLSPKSQASGFLRSFKWDKAKTALQNGPWGWFESAESFYFDNGFIKVGDRYKVNEEKVASSYLTTLLRSSPDAILEPEEHTLLDRMVKGDVVYVGNKKGKECFGIIISDREKYFTSLSFEKGKIAEIKWN